MAQRTALLELRLARFRSWSSLRWEGDGRPVAIHGPNGAGKTNILEAISLLSPGRGLRRAQGAELPHRGDAIGWRMTATVEAGGRIHEIVTGAESEGSRTVEIDGKSAPQTALGRLFRILWLVPVMDRLWIEGASERRRFLDRIAMSFEPAHADVALAYERAMRERNRLLKDGGDAEWFAALERQMAEAGERLARGRHIALDRLAAAQEGAETAFPRADLALVDPDGAPEAQWTEEELAGVLRDGRRRDMAAGRALAGPHRTDLSAAYAAKGMPARTCSTGEQKALLISLILANARALRAETASAPILLLDEVAAHLDEDRRAALYDEICALEAQAWMTGTGPELFEALGQRAEHLRVVADSDISGLRPVH
ncbi:MAG: DNA replication/repair protein RecF [Rubricella sp.]